MKYRASKASEYTKDKAQEIKEHIQEKGVAAQEFTIERWDAFSRKLDAWKQRRGESNKSLFSELNEEFRLLHAD